jgi:hypothetical protein
MGYINCSGSTDSEQRKSIGVFMSTSFDPIVSPSIVSKALQTIGNADAKLTKVKATIAAEQSKAFNMVLDAMVIACDKPKALFLKGNAATNPARAQVKGMFDAAVEKGYLTKATAASYQTAFWIAFEQGCAWSADLNNKKTADKQAGEKADTSTKASGKVETTDIPALHKTLSKALAQARILNQSMFVADLTDLIVDTWPDFKETVLTK